MIRVLVVDDQPMVRAGFAAIIEAEPGLSVAGTAHDGVSAVAAAQALRPDVILMDIRMPEMDGLTATKLLARQSDPARILILTTFDLDMYVFEALRAGASGFLLKDAQPDDLLQAIRVVARGEAMLGPAVTRRLIAAFANGVLIPSTTPMPLDNLTAREREVFKLVASGLSNAEVAVRIGVATGTVKTHVNALFTKLGVRDRVQATILAYDMGLVLPRVGQATGAAQSP